KTLLQQERCNILGAVVLMICLSCLDGIGVLLLLPMLAMLGVSTVSASSSSLTTFMLALFQTLGIPVRLEAVLGLYILIISVHACLGRTQSLLTLRIQHRFSTTLRRHLYDAMSHASWLCLVRLKASEMTQVLTEDIDRVGEGTYDLLRLASTASMMLVYLVL